ncbi:hypothetical protein D3C84_997090 [compost metagenome]
MPGPGDHRFKATNQFVLALRPGVKTLQPLGNGKVHALIKTGLEMQPVELIQASPVAAIQAVAPHQAQGHGHISTTLAGHHHAHRRRHALGQQAEERAGQIRCPTTYCIGVGVAGKNEIPLRLAQFITTVPAKFDALPRHLLTFFAHLLALA